MVSIHSPCEDELSAGSSSLDTSELFQEKSPKKINRPVANRWTDNLHLSKKRHSERGPSGDRVLGESAKVRQRASRRGRSRTRSYGAGCGGPLITLAQSL